jgi:hypothetical protein
MTINTYYYVFGFLVPIDDCIALLGFTIDKLTDEIRNNIMDEQCYDNNDEPVTDQRLVREWYEMECRDNYNTAYPLELDNHRFIVRSFCHDNDNNDKYYVVGVDIGEIDRFTGICTTNDSTDTPKQRIAALAQNTEWQRAIQKTKQSYSIFKKESHCVPLLKNGLFLEPIVYATTDDCDCCS